MKRENLSIAAILFLLVFVPVQALSGPNKAEIRWFNVVLKGVKVGYSKNIVETAEYNGKLCRKTSSFMKIALKRMGTGFEMDTSGLYYTTEDNTPLFFRYTEHQDRQVKVTEGKLNGENLELTVKLSSETQNKSLKYEKGAFLADSAEALITSEIKDLSS